MMQNLDETNTNLCMLQKELTDMLAQFVQKCEQNNLRYFLFYGTMLGAVRHHGFIPWDDDIDLLMPRNDLERFVDLYKNYYSETAYLDAYNCPKYDSFAPNVRINSNRVMLCQNREGKKTFTPAFLSIWIIDGLPDNPILKKTHIKKIFINYGLLRLARSSVQGTMNINGRSRKERALITINKTFHIGKFSSPRKAAEHFNNTLKKYPMEEGKECFIGWNPAGNRIFNREWFRYTKTVSFEGINCLIPIGYDEILKREYGDYTQLPTEDKRKPLHSIEIKFV